jgi:hypothetical protein
VPLVDLDMDPSTGIATLTMKNPPVNSLSLEMYGDYSLLCPPDPFGGVSCVDPAHRIVFLFASGTSRSPTR